MTTLHKIFSDEYYELIKDQLDKSLSIEKYKMDYFSIDESQLEDIAYAVSISPEELEQKMLGFAKADFDFNAAICLYEAYKDIPPLLASMPRFWDYISHTVLFKYVQKRWNKISENDPKTYIGDHWFTKSLMRGGLSNLWWSVYLTVNHDPSVTDPYRLTRIFFLNETFRTRSLNVISRIRNAIIGILEFLDENYEEVFSSAREDRGQFIANYFNRLGAVKLLSNMSKDFFKSECEKIKPQILLINNRADRKRISGVVELSENQ